MIDFTKSLISKSYYYMEKKKKDVILEVLGNYDSTKDKFIIGHTFSSIHLHQYGHTKGQKPYPPKNCCLPISRK